MRIKNSKYVFMSKVNKSMVFGKMSRICDKYQCYVSCSYRQLPSLHTGFNQCTGKKAKMTHLIKRLYGHSLEVAQGRSSSRSKRTPQQLKQNDKPPNLRWYSFTHSERKNGWMRTRWCGIPQTITYRSMPTLEKSKFHISFQTEVQKLLNSTISGNVMNRVLILA